MKKNYFKKFKYNYILINKNNLLYCLKNKKRVNASIYYIN